MGVRSWLVEKDETERRRVVSACLAFALWLTSTKRTPGSRFHPWWIYLAILLCGGLGTDGLTWVVPTFTGCSSITFSDSCLVLYSPLRRSLMPLEPN
jgi:hypothetical protein